MNHLDPSAFDSYLDGALAPAELAAAEAHLAECAHCRAELVQQRGVFLALHSLPAQPIPRDLTAAVLAEVAPTRAPRTLVVNPRRHTKAHEIGLFFGPLRVPSWINNASLYKERTSWYARAALAAQAAAITLLLVWLWPTLAAWAGGYVGALPSLPPGITWNWLPQPGWPAPSWLAGIDTALHPLLAGIGPLEAGLALAAALLVWLAGNRLLLGAHPSQEAA